jgi:hypothetical protein
VGLANQFCKMIIPDERTGPITSHFGTVKTQSKMSPKAAGS